MSEAEAAASFRTGVSGRLFQVRHGPLRSLAPAYVPFRLYEVLIHNRGVQQTSLFALDAFAGSLDLYEFQSPPEDAALVTVESPNALPVVLETEGAEALLCTKVERLLFQTGFFRIRGLRIETGRTSLLVYVPYWLGFFGRGQAAALRVMDAVRRRREGAKAEAVFRDWLTQ
ncbi:MAG: hypothetical protein ACRD5W_08340 [Candidatus Acidiferrales bacterium]